MLIKADDAHAVGGVWRPDLDLVAHAVSDEGLAQSRLVAHPTRLRVGLRRPDDPVHLLVLTVLSKADGASHRHQLAATWLFLDQDVVLDDLLELVDPRLHETLLVLGGVVFEVLGEVAELAGGLDLGSDGRAPHADELLVLLADGLEALGGDVNVLSHHFECRSEAGKPAQRCIGPFPPSALRALTPALGAPALVAAPAATTRGPRRCAPRRATPALASAVWAAPRSACARPQT